MATEMTSPVHADITVTRRQQTITAAYTSTGGDAVLEPGGTSRVRVNNNHPKIAVEYRVSGGAWAAIGAQKSVDLEIDLAEETLGLRRSEFAPDSMVVDIEVYSLPAGVESGGDPVLSADLVAQLQAAAEAGVLSLPSYTALPTINAAPTASITLDAGSGNTVGSARVTFCPPTDTIGAQRLMVPADETFTILVGQTRVFPLSVPVGYAVTMHAVGISSSTTYTGAAYVIGSAETDLADVIANDARFEWLLDAVKVVEVTLQQGTTTRTAVMSVIGRF